MMDESGQGGGQEHEHPPVPPAQGASSSERTWATFCHLAAFSVLLRIPVGLIAGPLVVWLIKRKDSPFVDRHGKAAVNFQLSVLVWAVVAGVIGSWAIPVLFRELWQQGIYPAFHGGAIFLGSLPGVGMLRLWFPLVAALVLLELICTIVAAVRANAGREVRYPFTIRFIR